MREFLPIIGFILIMLAFISMQTAVMIRIPYISSVNPLYLIVLGILLIGWGLLGTIGLIISLIVIALYLISYGWRLLW